MATRPLSSRPLNQFYFVFFLFNLPVSLLFDCQPFYPPNLIPSFISKLPEMYIQLSSDPLVGGGMGFTGQASDFTWLNTFVFVELFFQVPVFIFGMRGLWKDCCTVYLLLLIYGASTATTTLPCLTVLLSTPITSAQTIATGVRSITESQHLFLLSSYLPFFLIPLFMMLDMTLRISKLVQAGLAAEKKAK